jgi:hypothetical protein
LRRITAMVTGAWKATLKYAIVHKTQYGNQSFAGID